MRRVFIQKKNGEFVNENCYNAYFGFDKLGYEICTFEGYSPKNLSKDEIVVGWIGCVKDAMSNLGIDPPGEIDYPEELNAYWGRKIWKSTLNDVKPEEFPIFIKPVSGKFFDGRLVKSFLDLIGTKSQGVNTPIWKSSPVNFITEWRVYVRYGKVLDARKYRGDPFQKLDESIVTSAIEGFKSRPAAFSIDFGLTDDGRTLCVEVNDGYSLGSYGLFPMLYAKMISARWSEMVGVPDELIMI